jgi:hypothetical protein
MTSQATDDFAKGVLRRRRLDRPDADVQGELLLLHPPLSLLGRHDQEPADLQAHRSERACCRRAAPSPTPAARTTRCTTPARSGARCSGRCSSIWSASTATPRPSGACSRTSSAGSSSRPRADLHQARDGIITAVSAMAPGDLPQVKAGFAKRGIGAGAVVRFRPARASRRECRISRGVVESFGREQLYFAEEPAVPRAASRGARAPSREESVSREQLHVVVQNGRQFQQHHPEVPRAARPRAVPARASWTRQARTEAEARAHETCFGILPARGRRRWCSRSRPRTRGQQPAAPVVRAGSLVDLRHRAIRPRGRASEGAGRVSTRVTRTSDRIRQGRDAAVQQEAQRSRIQDAPADHHRQRQEEPQRHRRQGRPRPEVARCGPGHGAPRLRESRGRRVRPRTRRGRQRQRQRGRAGDRAGLRAASRHARPAADSLRRRGAGAVRQQAIRGQSQRERTGEDPRRGEHGHDLQPQQRSEDGPARRLTTFAEHHRRPGGGSVDVHGTDGGDVPQSIRQRSRPVPRRQDPGRPHHRRRRQRQRRHSLRPTTRSTNWNSAWRWRSCG